MIDCTAGPGRRKERALGCSLTRPAGRVESEASDGDINSDRAMIARFTLTPREVEHLMIGLSQTAS